MCGRYYVDDTTAREILELTGQIFDKLNNGQEKAGFSLKAADIYPAAMAPVLTAASRSLCCEWQRWGYPKFQKDSASSKTQVIFNARSESALEKPTFRESVLHHRLVIPAAWFYEWNKAKEKNIFYRKDTPALYMAGLFKPYPEGKRFVILTTQANASVLPVHERMPLVLEKDEITDWLLDDERTEALLHKQPCQLERRTEFEQLTLFR